MKAFTRISLCLAVAVLALAGKRDAAGQYVVAYPSTTAVVAYQPVVVPTSPALIRGWYPGKLLDTWAANRLAYRSAAVAAPLTTAMPVTSYRPVTAYQTSYLPVRTYRPLYYAPSIVATTAYSPVVTASAVCCDPCAATVTGYATTTSACCGTTVLDSGNYVEPTPVPELGSTGYRGSNSGQNGANGGQAEEKSVKEDNGQAGGQNTDAEGANWAPPPLRDPRLEALPDDPKNNVARNDRINITEAVYREKVRPQLANASGRATDATKARSTTIPSRAERDAMWTAVID